MEVHEKLRVLADASRFDLSCACGTKKKEDHRQRGKEGLWLYPVARPSGGVSIMLKTLLSNACVNDCRYCPFRNDQDTRRCTLSPDEVARLFMSLQRRLKLMGIFLSSGVVRSPDYTMDRMTAVARILRRKYRYRGWVHLKVIPGASDAAIEEAVSVAGAVSLNVEAPKGSVFRQLSTTKDYQRDIVRPMRLISRLTGPGMPHRKVKQSTQFIVGAGDESDADIVKATFGLYKRMGLNRVYFSAYQRGQGDPSLPGETRRLLDPGDLLTREHRLYQVDWLIRKYGFRDDEIPFEPGGTLSLSVDPKEMWARLHPERFPIDANRAEPAELLRVPGLGHVSVERILDRRRDGGTVRSIEDIGRPGKRLRKALAYLKFGA